MSEGIVESAADEKLRAALERISMLRQNAQHMHNDDIIWLCDIAESALQFSKGSLLASLCRERFPE
jgi:hypothetical protein